MNKELSGIVKVWDATVRKSHAAARKSANIIFSPMSVAHVDDDEIEKKPGEVYHADKMFANGDMYTGQWADGCPNGSGKYLWADGCMYVGDWVKGKTNGKGKFSWPGGATYEGQFKNGFMDGEGTYTGTSNDTYRGAWVFNMRHGKGSRSYGNGDHYEGEWRRGRQDGQGRYQWSNGNQYIGQWRHGKFNGNGTMIWGNGNRYDGCWEDGLPKGNGTYRWVDGSFYVGVWSKDPRDQSGTYYPSNSQTGNFDWDPQEVYDVDLRDCKISHGEKITMYPSQKVVNWPCEGDGLQKQPLPKTTKRSDQRRRASVDGRQSFGGSFSCGSDSDLGSDSCSGHRKKGDEGSYRSSDLDSPRGSRRSHIVIQPMKKQGETISKGHKNYELMLNLQLGIRHSVGRPASATSLDLRATVFDTRDKIWTRFPPEGSKHTPPHQSCEFRWKDYCPVVFRTLRKLFNVDPADYMLSICGNDALRELSSPGKSGSFFYLTHDDKYMIKTMKKSEVKVLLRMLPAYYNHVRAFKNTLITKFFGLHCVKMAGSAQKKVRFVIMGNLLCTDLSIHRRFDLKGSSHGRITDKAECEIDSTTTLKDLDLKFIFRLQKNSFNEFCRQVDKDCDFLEHERIMDYSLLVGVHFNEISQSGEPITTADHDSEDRTPIANGELENGSTPQLSRGGMELIIHPSRRASTSLGINVPARAELTVRRNDSEPQLVGEPTGQHYDVILYFGIIDILQDYDISKKLEHAYKSFHFDPTSISAVDPRQYSRRFRDFIFKVFAEDS